MLIIHVVVVDRKVIKENKNPDERGVWKGKEEVKRR